MRNWDPQLSESQPDSIPTRRAVPSLSYPSSEARSSASSSNGPPSACQWERDWKDVQAVAKHVGIPKDKVKLVDYSKEYWSKVFEPSVAVWEAGGTPNPDVMCNKWVGMMISASPRSRSNPPTGLDHLC
jgi:tRNA-specific 2-thiouridylase